MFAAILCSALVMGATDQAAVQKCTTPDACCVVAVQPVRTTVVRVREVVRHRPVARTVRGVAIRTRRVVARVLHPLCWRRCCH